MDPDGGEGRWQTGPMSADAGDGDVEEVSVASQQATERPGVVSFILTVGLALPAGVAVLLVVNAVIDFVWITVPDRWGSDLPALYLLAVPVVAGLVVAAARRLPGAGGHGPLKGLSLGAIDVRDYPGIIASILATLAGGVVLGPEVALIATGSVVGVVVSRVTKRPTQAIPLGIAGGVAAILALVVLAREANSAPQASSYAFDLVDTVWAIPVAALSVAAIVLVRRLAHVWEAVVGPASRIWALVVTGAITGLCALAFQEWADGEARLILGSGEGSISPLLAIDSLGVLLAALGLKAVAYVLALGSGFRGGPVFPAVFIGVAVAGSVHLAGADASVESLTMAGIMATLAATVSMSWKAAAAASVLVGFAFGSWALIPAALVGGLLGRATPRLGDPG